MSITTPTNGRIVSQASVTPRGVLPGGAVPEAPASSSEPDLVVVEGTEGYAPALRTKERGRLFDALPSGAFATARPIRSGHLLQAPGEEGRVLRSSLTISAAAQLELLSGFSTIEGDLIIAASDIEDLKGLADLRRITGRLIVKDSPRVASLQGLKNLVELGGLEVTGNKGLLFLGLSESLNEISGSVVFENNEKVAVLDGLENICRVGGNIRVIGNSTLSSFPAFSRLLEVGGSVFVTNNAALSDVVAFNAVERVGGGVEFSSNQALARADSFKVTKSIGGTVRVASNPAMVELAGFDQLRSLGAFIASGNKSLVAIDAFADLQQITGQTGGANGSGPTIALELRDHPALAAVSGMRKMQFAVGKVVLHTNPALADIDFLAGISRFSGELTVEQMHALPNVAGLRGARSINGPVMIRNNNSLRDIDDLRGTTSIQGSFEVTDNPALTTFKGTNGLVEVAGVSIARNAAVVDIDGFKGVQKLPYLNVTSMPTATTVSGFASLRQVDQNVTVGESPRLVGLPGLSKLESVKTLDLYQLDALTNLDDFRSVSKGQQVTVRDGDALTSIAGLQRLTGSDSLTLQFRRLPALSSLDGLQNIDRVSEIELSDMRSLADISALQKVSCVADDLRLNNLPALRDLDGLIGLKTVGNKLTIRDLPSLSDAWGIRNVTAANFLVFENNTSAKNLRVLLTPTFEDLINSQSARVEDNGARWNALARQWNRLLERIAPTAPADVRGKLT